MIYVNTGNIKKTEENLRKGFVRYKLLTKEVFVRPGPVFYPCVQLDNEMKMSYSEYNFLSDCTYILPR